MPLTVFSNAWHLAGSAADADKDIDVNPAALRLDFAILDNPAMLAFSTDGIVFLSPREVSGGVFASVDLVVRKIRIRNKTAGVVARYDFTGYFSPIEITGAPYVRPL